MSEIRAVDLLPDALLGTQSGRKDIIQYVQKNYPVPVYTMDKFPVFIVDGVFDYLLSISKDGTIDICGSVPVRPPYNEMYIEWATRVKGLFCLLKIEYIESQSTLAISTFEVFILKDNAGKLIAIEGPKTMYIAPLDERGIIDRRQERIMDGLEPLSLLGLYDSHEDRMCDYQSFMYKLTGTSRADNGMLWSEYHMECGRCHTEIGLHALKFINTKNIVAVDCVIPSKVNKIFRKKHNRNRIVYKTLKISGSFRKDNLSVDMDIAELGRRLHSVRGHFSDYTENPLFGIYHGIFWVRSHVRGNKELGEVKKRYDVKPRSKDDVDTP